MLEEVAAKKVWPGFTSSTWPLALYDGEKTFLLWHPNPPAEFKPVPGRPGILICPGRYPDVRANSTAEIAGVRTATLVVTSGLGRSALIEETFHVFWFSRHRVFRPNEMARYAYPLTDAENLAGLLAESEALARALEVGAPEQAWRWAAAALEQRSARRSRLDEGSADFERDLEMLEGPANFVSDFAMGKTPAGTALMLRRQNYAKATGEWKRGLEEIRWRFYSTGEAMAWLLERFSSGWKERLEADPELTMQRLLEIELAQKGGAQAAAFSAAEKDGFRADAQWAIADLARRRSELRAGLEARGGARLIVETAPGAEPLQLGRFDPISLFVLGNGEVVHANFITLSDANGSVELENPDFVRRLFGGVVGITESAGRRPLGDGTRRLTIFGIKGQPKVERKDGTVTIEAPGVRLTWKGAEVETEGATIKVTVGSGAGVQRLAQVLDRARAYCLKLEKAALDFTCLEKIEERTYRLPEIEPDAVVDSPGTIAGKMGHSAPTPRLPYTTRRYVYDYQFVRKDGKNAESRILIEEDGRKRREENAQLTTGTVRVENALFGPVGLLGEQWQALHDYRIIGEEVLGGKKTVVIEAVPKPSLDRPHSFGRIWVREDDGSVVKISWDQRSVGNFQAIEQTARRLQAEPQLTSITEYGQEKNGLCFPSKDSTEEAYLKDGKKYVRSLTTILYKDYKFFTVETEIRY